MLTLPTPEEISDKSGNSIVRAREKIVFKNGVVMGSYQAYREVAKELRGRIADMEKQGARKEIIDYFKIFIEPLIHDLEEVTK